MAGLARLVPGQRNRPVPTPSRPARTPVLSADSGRSTVETPLVNGAGRPRARPAAPPTAHFREHVTCR